MGRLGNHKTPVACVGLEREAASTRQQEKARSSILVRGKNDGVGLACQARGQMSQSPSRGAPGAKHLGRAAPGRVLNRTALAAVVPIGSLGNPRRVQTSSKQIHPLLRGFCYFDRRR